MNTSLITAQNLRTGTLAPTIREMQRGESPRREDREGEASRKGLSSRFVPFAVDDVSISSSRGAAAEGVREQLPVHVPASGSSRAVEERRDGQDGALTVKGPGSAVESGVIRYTVNVGPYDTSVSTMAMRRYGEASSHRAWRPSTFEVTI
jgi:hypothetical protein